MSPPPIAPTRDTGWRFFARTLDGSGTETPIYDDLPLTSVQSTIPVSGPWTMSATLASGNYDLSLLNKYACSLWAEKDGVVRGGGILTDKSVTRNSATLTTIGYSDYPTGQPWVSAEEYAGIQVDPLDVVRKIWAWLQAQQYGNLGVVVDSLTTPVRIGVRAQYGTYDTQSDTDNYTVGPVQLVWWDTFDLGAKISQLATSTPFDWTERHQWNDDGTLGHFIDFGYPYTGRRLPNRFVVGENVTAPVEIGVGGLTDYASGIYTKGVGEGRSLLRSLSTRPTGGIRRILVVDDQTSQSQAMIDATNAATLRQHHGLNAYSSVTIRDHPHCRVSELSAGDEILLLDQPGAVTESVWLRVMSISETLGGRDDTAQLTVTRSDTQ